MHCVSKPEKMGPQSSQASHLSSPQPKLLSLTPRDKFSLLLQAATGFPVNSDQASWSTRCRISAEWVFVNHLVTRDHANRQLCCLFIWRHFICKGHVYHLKFDWSLILQFFKSKF